MTPAEIEAAKMVVELDPDQEGIGEAAKASRTRWRSDLAPALLSALEEARRERDAVRSGWDVLRTSLYHRAEAAESRADALRAEVEQAQSLLDCEESTTAEACGECRACLNVKSMAALARVAAAESECARLRGRVAEAERERDLALAHDREVTARRSEDLVALAESKGLVSRLRGQVDALQARADALQAEAQQYADAAAEARIDADRQHDAMAASLAREHARADAAWRAGVEAAAGSAEEAAMEWDHVEQVHDAIVRVAAEIRALPPPSATAAPAEEASFPGVVAAGLLAPGQALAAPAEEEKCPELCHACRVALTPTAIHAEWCPGRAPSRGEVG